jgi:hypothetical protein
LVPGNLFASRDSVTVYTPRTHPISTSVASATRRLSRNVVRESLDRTLVYLDDKRFMSKETLRGARRHQRISLPEGMFVAWYGGGEQQVSRVKTLGIGGLFLSLAKIIAVTMLQQRS